MLKLSLLCLFLVVTVVHANLQCEMCKLVVGAAEADLATDNDLKVRYFQF
jgi:hypothetical protein